MKRHKTIIALLALTLAIPAGAQKIKVYLNPGHGSWGPDDRPLPTIPYPMLESTGRPDTCGFYESNTNLWKALECGERLKKNGNFTVKFSRRKNGPFPYVKGASNEFIYNRALSEISEEVDTWGADLFLSIHSNATTEGALVNYPLFLYRGTDAEEYVENSKAMAQKIWPRLTEAMHAGFEVMTHYNSSTNIRGDIDFYHSSWTNKYGITGYLGVLHHMAPGFLSEGYFHTYQPARHRALNQDWCRQEGIRYYRGIADYYGVHNDELGCIMGRLYIKSRKTDKLDYFTVNPGSFDEDMPANGVTVRLKDANGDVVGTYETDQNYNGIFVFYDLVPGRYYIEMKGEGLSTRQGRINLTTVKAKTTTYKNIFLIPGTSTPFDDETAIEVIPNKAESHTFYDLSGRKVANPRKGIYIENGKKVVF